MSSTLRRGRKPGPENPQIGDIQIPVNGRCYSIGDILGNPHVENEFYAELMKEYQANICRLAYRITGQNIGEDVLQETFLSVFKNLPHFRGRSQFKTWLYRIAFNVAYNYMRINRKYHSDESLDYLQESSEIEDTKMQSPYDFLRMAETMEYYNFNLGKIGEKQRDVVCMHDLKGYTIKEIAEIVGIPVGTSKSRLFYGRQKLKTHLQEMEKMARIERLVDRLVEETLCKMKQYEPSTEEREDKPNPIKINDTTLQNISSNSEIQETSIENWWDIARISAKKRRGALKELAERDFGGIFSVSADSLASHAGKNARFVREHYCGYALKSAIKKDLAYLRREEYENDASL